MKGLRKSLLVALFVAATAVVVFRFLVLGPLVRRRIETSATAMVGAKVEIDRAFVSLFPLGLRLLRVRVASPDDPATNAVEAGRVSFDLDGWKLLGKKVHIREMSLERVRLNTPRGARAAQGRAQRDEADGRGVSLPSFTAPGAEEILGREELESVRLAEELKKDLDARIERWREEIEGLADKRKLAQYRARARRSFEAGGETRGRDEAAALLKEIKQEVLRLRKARTGFRNELRVLRYRLREAERAPLEDIGRITGKYALSAAGASNMSRLLFSRAISSGLDAVLGWRERLVPAAARARNGAHRAERRRGADLGEGTEPDFLISRARVSLVMPVGEIAGEVSNIASDQSRLGKPLKFSFEAGGLEGLSSLRLEGEINRTRPGMPRDRVALRVRGYALRGVPLSLDPAFPITLEEGAADIDLRAGINGTKLTARLTARLAPVSISAGGAEDHGPVGNVLAQALSGVRALKVKATVKGTTDEYTLGVTSDLDPGLKAVVSNVAAAEAAILEARLRPAVLEKTRGPLKNLRAGMAVLEGMERGLTESISAGEGLVKEMAATKAREMLKGMVDLPE